MEHSPVVIVHCLADALAALAQADTRATPVTLLSGPGAALYAGCGWWRALVERARTAYPNVACADILDCADGTGQAMAALRIGTRHLVLWPEAPGRQAVVAAAEVLGCLVLPTAPKVDTAVATGRGGSSRDDRRGSGGDGRASGGDGRGSGDKSRAPG
jgi:hypothetical protein